MKTVFRIIISIISIVFLIWFILPTLMFRVINPGNILGILICACLIFRFAFKNAYIRLKERFYSKKVSRIVFKTILACWAIFGIYAAVISGIMCTSMFSYAPEGVNPTVIVLGAQVKPWGPSSVLWNRINAAQKYLDENKNVNAVLSGGKGADEPVSEAQSIHNNLKKGDDVFYLEDESTDTRENIRFSKRIINNNNLNKNIAIVTDSYHQFRAGMIARKEGFKGEIYAVNAIQDSVGLICYPTFFVREWIAIPAEIFN